MATSHSGWGNCPAHKKNQLAMYPGVWHIRTSVLSVISVVGMWHVMEIWRDDALHQTLKTHLYRSSTLSVFAYGHEAYLAIFPYGCLGPILIKIKQLKKT